MEYPYLPPIELLNQAIHIEPPDLRTARTAISALNEQVGDVNGLDREVRIGLARQTAALCGEVALMDVDQADIIEFAGHGDRFGTIVTALGGTATAQTEPTSTAGKVMTGGKTRVSAAL